MFVVNRYFGFSEHQVFFLYGKRLLVSPWKVVMRVKLGVVYVVDVTFKSGLQTSSPPSVPTAECPW